MSKADVVDVSDISPSASSESFHNDTYTRAKADNGSGAAYQDAVGAPVEESSPLGYNVGWATVIFLNINQLIGTGIFSTRMYLFWDIFN